MNTKKDQIVEPIKKAKIQMQHDLVIAHRGTTYWAPEETEAAMRWARNMGADYLEFDLQRTKDGKLIALHDDRLLRTTDIALKFPSRKDLPVSAFSYAELMTLDAGTWFNIAAPAQARPTFVGLGLLSLEDVVMIAEGKRIKRDEAGRRVLEKNTSGTLSTVYETDPADLGHRPGIYVETKVPALFPGIEEDLRLELMRLGWYHPNEEMLKEIPVQQGKVSIANTPERVVLQTFSKASLAMLQKVFERPLPTCFLLWRGSDTDDLPDDQPSTFEDWVAYGKNHGAHMIGPSIAGAPNNYVDLLHMQQAQIIRKYGLLIHAYSFDTENQMDKYATLVDGMFTNRADLSLLFYKRAQFNSAESVLKGLGY